MKKQRILSALLALCLVFSLVPTALAVNADDFTDVGRDSWCYEYVDYVTSKGYFLGTSDTTFSPDRNMTRAMFVVVLSRFDGAKVDNSQSAFTDVEPGSWCAGAINWAAAKKIVEGKGDGKFAPNDPITRAQMCAIMDRYLNYYMNEEEVTLPEDGAVSSMTDRQQVPSYAVSAVKQCQRYGLINGYSDGTFRPQALSTRAHVAAVVYRMANLVKNAEAVKKPSGSGEHRGHSKPTYTYTLTYDANGGTGAPAPQTKPNTKATSWTFTVSDTVPTREGYTFQGWAGTGDAAAPEAQYAAGSTVTLTASNRSLTLYAVWQKNAPEGDPNDLVGNAVLASVTQVNDKYDSLKQAVVEAVEELNSAGNNGDGYPSKEQLDQVKDAINNVVSVSHVTANFTSGDTDPEHNPREVKVKASVSVNDGQVASVIEKATQFASDLIDGGYSRPSAEDVEGFLSSVKNAVKKQSGIDLTDQTLDEIKTQVLDKVKGEGKVLWANFRDNEGVYKCGDIDITLDGVTYATVKVGQNGNTTLEGDKTEIAKNLGTAIAKKMYQDVKLQSKAAFASGISDGYISDPTLTAGVQLIFAPSANTKYANMTFTDGNPDAPIYPNVYNVSLSLQLDSNGLVEYKYDAGNYLRLNITESIQKAYNEAVNEAAATITRNGQTQEQVVNEVKKILTDQVDTIVTEVQGQLDSYGITLTHTTAASLKDALLPKVEGWVETNWTRIVASLDGNGLTGLNNTALIDAAWPLIEQDIDDVDMDAMLQEQIERQLAENGIDESWIVGKVNETLSTYQGGAIQTFIDMGSTFEPTVPVSSVDDINALLTCTSITAHVPGGLNVTITYDDGNPATGDENGKDKFGDYIKAEVLAQANDMLEEQFSTSETLSALLEQNRDVADYLLYSALVQMHLDFDDEKAEAAGENNSTLTALKAAVKTVAKEKMEEKLNQKLAAIDVTEYLEEGELAEADYQAKIDLLNSLKFPDIQTKTADDLVSVLTSATMTEIVGDKGNSYVEKYLGKVINKAMNVLPAGASVTIGGATLNKNTLDGLRKADTTMEAIQAVADILAQFDDDLSIDSFAPEAGQVMTVAYNGRTASVHLVIYVEPLA